MCIRDRVDYEEIKNFSIPVKVNGEVVHMSIDQINSEVGRARAGGKEVQEAKLQMEELAKEKAFVAEQKKVIQDSAELAQHKANLAAFGGEIRKIQNAKEEARKDGRTEDWSRLNMQMEPMVAQYNAANAQLKQMSNETLQSNLEIQAKILEDKGMGTLLSDTQRKEALGAYLDSNYSPSTIHAITHDAELLMLAEKARQLESSKGAAKKAVIKGNGKKTLRSGDSKVQAAKSQKKAAQTRKLVTGQATQADYDAAMFDLAKDLI